MLETVDILIYYTKFNFTFAFFDLSTTIVLSIESLRLGFLKIYIINIQVCNM